MPSLTRRELIRTGIGGVALLALARCAPSATASGRFDDPGYAYRVLSAGDRDLIGAVGAAMLDGALPADAAAHQVALLDVVRGVDVAIAGLPPSVQGEIAQLFSLLNFPLTRGFTTGIWNSWENASRDSVAAFLGTWQGSGVALFRSGYQALHQLAMAAWYGNNASWARVGYPGPPVVA